MILDKYRWLEIVTGLSQDKLAYIRDAANQCDVVYEAYLGARHSDIDWVPAEVDRFMEAWLNGSKTGVDILENFRVLYLQGHPDTPNPPDTEPVPNPEPAPQPSGEIVDFVQVPGTLGDKTYFGVGPMNGEICYGEYGRQDNYKCALYKQPRVKVGDFDAESIFNICDGIITIEQGGPNRKAQIWYNGQCVYEHPKWNIMLNCHRHTDGRYYVSGQYYGDPSDPAGVLVSSDKVNWSEYFTNSYEYRFYDMCSQAGSLWIAATSSGMDWGENDCNPTVFQDGNNIAWRDTEHNNCGFWGIASFLGYIYLGRTGQAGVVRLSDHKTVLDLSHMKAVMKLFVDEATNTLLATVSAYNGGAQVWATKNGDDWYQINWEFSVPSLYSVYQDPVTKDIYLTGGNFDHGPGKFYVSKRQYRACTRGRYERIR